MKLAASLLLLAIFATPGTVRATPPVVELDGIKPGEKIFETASRTQPLVLKSAEDAAKHFDEKTVAALAEAVDFDEQLVVIFAWRGSGQDKLSALVQQSFPERVRFTYQPGLTRDLRPHVYVYALRSNVTWTAPQ